MNVTEQTELEKKKLPKTGKHQRKRNHNENIILAELMPNCHMSHEVEDMEHSIV